MADDNFLRIDLGAPQTQGAAAMEHTAAIDLTQHQFTDMEMPEQGMYTDQSPTGLVVTEMIATPAPSDQRRLILIGVGLLCLSLGLAFYLFSSEGSKDPFASLFAFFTGQSADVETVKPVKAAKKPVAAPVAKVPENPYWDLPNQVPSNAQETVRQWTAAEELLWRKGIAHRFNFQHYKTIADVRSYKLKGSEVILREGLTQKKFWSRMNAAFGLADMGFAVDLDSMEKVIGNARPDLVNNFFKRYESTQTEGERYILRQALRVVEAKPRLTILKALSSQDDKLTQLYLAAATFDPIPQIKSYSEMQLRAKKVSVADISMYKNFVLGATALPTDFNTTSIAPKLVAQKKASIAPKVQKVSSSSFVNKVEYFDGTKSESLNESGLLDDGYKNLEVIEIK